MGKNVDKQQPKNVPQRKSAPIVETREERKTLSQEFIGKFKNKFSKTNDKLLKCAYEKLADVKQYRGGLDPNYLDVLPTIRMAVAALYLHTCAAQGKLIREIDPESGSNLSCADYVKENNLTKWNDIDYDSVLINISEQTWLEKMTFGDLAKLASAEDLSAVFTTMQTRHLPAPEKNAQQVNEIKPVVQPVVQPAPKQQNAPQVKEEPKQPAPKQEKEEPKQESKQVQVPQQVQQPQPVQVVAPSEQGNRYQTFVDGIYGTGTSPLDPVYQRNHQHGSFYGGFVVTEDIKKQLKNQPVSEFLHFEDGENGEYHVMHKIPEKGRHEPKEGEDGPAVDYKLREYMNRVTQYAYQFSFKEDGTLKDDNAVKEIEKVKNSDIIKGCGISSNEEAEFTAFLKDHRDTVTNLCANMNLQLHKVVYYEAMVDYLPKLKDDSKVGVVKKFLEDSYDDYRMTRNKISDVIHMDPEGNNTFLNFCPCDVTGKILEGMTNSVNNYRRSQGSDELKFTPVEVKFTEQARRSGTTITFPYHVMSAVEVKLNGQPYTMTMESTAPPFGKMFYQPDKNPQALGLYQNVEQIKETYTAKENYVTRFYSKEIKVDLDKLTLEERGAIIDDINKEYKTINRLGGMEYEKVRINNYRFSEEPPRIDFNIDRNIAPQPQQVQQPQPVNKAVERPLRQDEFFTLQNLALDSYNSWLKGDLQQKRGKGAKEFGELQASVEECLSYLKKCGAQERIAPAEMRKKLQTISKKAMAYELQKIGDEKGIKAFNKGEKVIDLTNYRKSKRFTEYDETERGRIIAAATLGSCASKLLDRYYAKESKKMQEDEKAVRDILARESVAIGLLRLPKKPAKKPAEKSVEFENLQRAVEGFCILPSKETGKNIGRLARAYLRTKRDPRSKKPLGNWDKGTQGRIGFADSLVDFSTKDPLTKNEPKVYSSDLFVAVVTGRSLKFKGNANKITGSSARDVARKQAYTMLADKGSYVLDPNTKNLSKRDDRLGLATALLLLTACADQGKSISYILPNSNETSTCRQYLEKYVGDQKSIDDPVLNEIAKQPFVADMRLEDFSDLAGEKNLFDYFSNRMEMYSSYVPKEVKKEDLPMTWPQQVSNAMTYVVANKLKEAPHLVSLTSLLTDAEESDPEAELNEAEQAGVVEIYLRSKAAIDRKEFSKIIKDYKEWIKDTAHYKKSFDSMPLERVFSTFEGKNGREVLKRLGKKMDWLKDMKKKDLLALAYTPLSVPEFLENRKNVIRVKEYLPGLSKWSYSWKELTNTAKAYFEYRDHDPKLKNIFESLKTALSQQENEKLDDNMKEKVVDAFLYSNQQNRLDLIVSVETINKIKEQGHYTEGMTGREYFENHKSDMTDPVYQEIMQEPWLKEMTSKGIAMMTMAAQTVDLASCFEYMRTLQQPLNIELQKAEELKPKPEIKDENGNKKRSDKQPEKEEEKDVSGESNNNKPQKDNEKNLLRDVTEKFRTKAEQTDDKLLKMAYGMLADEKVDRGIPLALLLLHAFDANDLTTDDFYLDDISVSYKDYLKSYDLTKAGAAENDPVIRALISETQPFLSKMTLKDLSYLSDLPEMADGENIITFFEDMAGKYDPKGFNKDSSVMSNKGHDDSQISGDEEEIDKENNDKILFNADEEEADKENDDKILFNADGDKNDKEDEIEVFTENNEEEPESREKQIDAIKTKFSQKKLVDELDQAHSTMSDDENNWFENENQLNEETSKAIAVLYLYAQKDVPLGEVLGDNTLMDKTCREFLKEYKESRRNIAYGEDDEEEEYSDSVQLLERVIEKNDWLQTLTLKDIDGLANTDVKSYAEFFYAFDPKLSTEKEPLTEEEREQERAERNRRTGEVRVKFEEKKQNSEELKWAYGAIGGVVKDGGDFRLLGDSISKFFDDGGKLAKDSIMAVAALYLFANKEKSLADLLGDESLRNQTGNDYLEENKDEESLETVVKPDDEEPSVLERLVEKNEWIKDLTLEDMEVLANTEEKDYAAFFARIAQKEKIEEEIKEEIRNENINVINVPQQPANENESKEENIINISSEPQSELQPEQNVPQNNPQRQLTPEEKNWKEQTDKAYRYAFSETLSGKTAHNSYLGTFLRLIRSVGRNLPDSGLDEESQDLAKELYQLSKEAEGGSNKPGRKQAEEKLDWLGNIKGVEIVALAYTTESVFKFFEDKKKEIEEKKPIEEVNEIKPVEQQPQVPNVQQPQPVVPQQPAGEDEIKEENIINISSESQSEPQQNLEKQREQLQNFKYLIGYNKRLAERYGTIVPWLWEKANKSVEAMERMLDPNSATRQQDFKEAKEFYPYLYIAINSEKRTYLPEAHNNSFVEYLSEFSSPEKERQEKLEKKFERHVISEKKVVKGKITEEDNLNCIKKYITDVRNACNYEEADTFVATLLHIHEYTFVENGNIIKQEKGEPVNEQPQNVPQPAPKQPVPQAQQQDVPQQGLNINNNNNIDDEQQVEQPAEREPAPAPLTNDFTDDYRFGEGEHITYDMLMTGNVKELEMYLSNQPVGKLTGQEEKHLKQLITANRHIQYLQDNRLSNKRTELPQLEEREDGKILLKGNWMERNQSCSQGCWSVAGEMLLKSRGVYIPQEMLRAFRSYKGKSGDMPQDYLDKKTVRTFNTDSSDEVVRCADVITSTLPNTGMRVRYYKFEQNDFDTDATLKEKKSAIKEKLLADIQNTIKVKRSPVSLFNNGHYYTVLGVDPRNEQLYVRDSLAFTNDVFACDVSRLVDLSAQKEIGGGTIQVSWVEDLKFGSKDGLGRLYDENGKLPQNPENCFVMDSTVTVQQAKVVMQLGGVDNLSYVTDHYYLPNELTPEKDLKDYHKIAPPDILHGDGLMYNLGNKGQTAMNEFNSHNLVYANGTQGTLAPFGEIPERVEQQNVVPQPIVQPKNEVKIAADNVSNNEKAQPEQEISAMPEKNEPQQQAGADSNVNNGRGQPEQQDKPENEDFSIVDPREDMDDSLNEQNQPDVIDVLEKNVAIFMNRERTDADDSWLNRMMFSATTDFIDFTRAIRRVGNSEESRRLNGPRLRVEAVTYYLYANQNKTLEEVIPNFKEFAPPLDPKTTVKDYCRQFNDRSRDKSEENRLVDWIANSWVGNLETKDIVKMVRAANEIPTSEEDAINKLSSTFEAAKDKCMLIDVQREMLKTYLASMEDSQSEIRGEGSTEFRILQGYTKNCLDALDPDGEGEYPSVESMEAITQKLGTLAGWYLNTKPGEDKNYSEKTQRRINIADDLKDNAEYLAAAFAKLGRGQKLQSNNERASDLDNMRKKNAMQSFADRITISQRKIWGSGSQQFRNIRTELQNYKKAISIGADETAAAQRLREAVDAYLALKSDANKPRRGWNDNTKERIKIAKDLQNYMLRLYPPQLIEQNVIEQNVIESQNNAEIEPQINENRQPLPVKNKGGSNAQNQINQQINENRQPLPVKNKGGNNAQNQINQLNNLLTNIKKANDMSEEFTDLQNKVEECVTFMRGKISQNPDYRGVFNDKETQEKLGELGKYARTYLRTQQGVNGEKYDDLDKAAETRYELASKIKQLAEPYEVKHYDIVVTPKNYEEGKEMLESLDKIAQDTYSSNLRDVVRDPGQRFFNIVSAFKGLKSLENDPKKSLDADTREKAVKRIEMRTEKFVDEKMIAAEKTGKKPDANTMKLIVTAEVLRDFAKGFREVLPGKKLNKTNVKETTLQNENKILGN